MTNTTKGTGARGGRAPAGKRPLRAKGAGSPQWRGDHRFVRVSLPDGTRPWYRLCQELCTCHQMSDARAADRAAKISAEERARVGQQIVERREAEVSKRVTVETFGTRWTSGELYELHGEVKGLKIKKSANDDAYRLARYVYPEIGAKAVADVTEQDVERVMANVNRRAREGKRGRREKLRQRTKYQVYQCMRRLFDLAVRPGRLREDSPVRDYLRPNPDATKKLYGYLFPSEVLALLGCKGVPIARRVFYALAVYTGLRKGSLYALTWSGIEFEHGTLTSLHSKTGLPQMFEIPRGLVELLAAWYEHQGRPARDAAIVSDVGVREEHEAAALRDDLKAAGVTRAVLHDRADNIEPMRFHDLRATFVTWAMRQGRGDGWISDRTGHLTPEMRSRYARAARTLADLKYDPFPDVSKAIPELLEARDNVVSIATAKRP